MKCLYQQIAFLIILSTSGIFLALFPDTGFSGQKGLTQQDPRVVVARSTTVALRLSAYAQVEPIRVVKLKAAKEGVVGNMTILPGEAVKAGAILGRLTGPEVDVFLAERRGSVKKNQAALTTAEKILAGERQKIALHLTTQNSVYRAEANLAKAKADLENSRVRLQAADKSVVLKAPVDGHVLTVKAANGEQVQTRSTILTLQPKGGLWLTAHYYGLDAARVRVGMTGLFKPAGGETSIPVKVRTVIAPLAPDGGQGVGLLAILPAPSWFSGETGEVTLLGAKRTYVVVPTRSLFLDQGRWWVLVSTKQGLARREVLPGPSRGSSTLLTLGLTPGARVVVENAYLKAHRNVSREYQLPD